MKKYAAVLLAFCMLLSAVCAAAEGGAAEDSAVPVEKKTFPRIRRSRCILSTALTTSPIRRSGISWPLPTG